MTAVLLHLRNLLAGPIARGSIASFAIRIFGLALVFAQGVLAARLLGPAGYGIAAVGMVIAQVGATVVLGGRNGIAVGMIARSLATGRFDAIRAHVRRAGILVGIGGLIAAVSGPALVVAAPEAFAPYQTALLFGPLIIPALALIFLFRGIAQGFGDVAGAQWPGDLLRPFLLVAAIGATLAAGSAIDPRGFLVLVAATALVAAFAGWRTVARHLANTPRDRKARGAGGSADQAAGFFGLALIGIVQAEFATLVLGALSTPDQVGVFQPIARLTMLMTLPVQAAAMRYAARVAELTESGERQRLERITRTFTRATTLATIALSGTILLAGPWLLALYGAAFAQQAPLLAIVAFAQVFNAACGPCGHLLTMSGRARLALVGQVAGLATGIALGLLLVPALGALGAAWALAGSLIVWNAVSWAIARSVLGFEPSIFARN